ncbi:MAG: metal-sensitive transcriptional regulator [Chloroflexia bacterium]|nr:metal-sensitive transcriptional regulator [Chloroflexia bacterium]
MSQSVRRTAPVASQAEDGAILAPNGEQTASNGPDPRGHSYDADKARIVARLKRIEGQVRGISRMVEEDKYCIDILTQVSAVIASTRSVGMLVLEDHIRGCVMNADPDHREATLEELNLAIDRFVRSVGN